VPTPLEPIPADLRQTLGLALDQDPAARALAADVVRRGLTNVVLVGCGGSLVVTYPVHYLLERNAAAFPVFQTTSAEFNYRKPIGLGRRSLVLVSSHTGTTPETVEAARVAKAVGATVAAVTRFPDSTLAAAADVAFTYLSDDTIWEAAYVLFGQIGYALLQQTGEDEDYAEIRTVFEALPDALLSAEEEAETLCHTVASRLADEPIIYVLGAGPNYGAAYGLAMCYLQEMQWMHAAAFNAGEFFHGAFEVVVEKVPVIVLLGEDETRPMAERALDFVTKHSRKGVAIDSRSFALPGIGQHRRPIVSPMVLGAVVGRLAAHLAAVRDHPLELRRYMFKVPY
jgi:fructoselysine 6-phosphate deglycase